ncbi:MAG: transposase [Pseudomonadota bacterium]|nr:transposase [Pseudomonadota bacterium]
MKSKQLSFFKKLTLEHGGTLGKGKRKGARPISTKHPIHLVYRASKARAKLSLLNFSRRIDKILSQQAQKFGVSIYEKANSGNHLHLLIRGKKRVGIQKFYISTTALIARLVTGTKKGNKFGKFWDHLIFSRVLTSWSREFLDLKDYLVQNTLETLGLVPFRARLRHGARHTNLARSNSS